MTIDDTARVPIDRLAELLGRGVTTQAIQADLSAGAPTNEDGTIDVRAYAAWLHREIEA